MQYKEETLTLNALDHLRALVQDDMDQVDATIIDMVGSHVELINDISIHTISSGGKRLRPMLTLACARMCGYEQDAHIHLATSIEFMHTATLLHDDVVDVSLLRRGKKTANEVWGNKESILVGDFLLGRAFHLIGKADSLEVFKILSKAAMVISEGEVMQLAAEGDLDISVERYFQIIGAKTAALFAAACQVGGVLARQSEEKVQCLYDYGYHLGMAFQIVDDALDYSAYQQTLGKRIGDDFRESKITYPILKAYAVGNAEEKHFWQRTVANRQQQEADFSQAMALILKHQGIADSMQLASDYASKAELALTDFPAGSFKEVLTNILGFVVERRY